jgi:hypothetical protein
LTEPQASSTFELGPLRIVWRPESYPWEGNPAAGGDSQVGTAAVAGVTGGGGVAVDVAVITWAAGSREVAAIDCHGSPPRIQRLARGGRMGIHVASDTQEWMELRISRLTSADWSSEFQTTLPELKMVTRLAVGERLSELGATALGTRADVLGESGRRRNELAVVFPRADFAVPVAAYCCVRVLPLLYAHGRDGAELIH